MLVLNGNHYVKKFSDPSRNNGFFILKMRLRRWFHVPMIWVICYSILFGIDIATVDLNKRYTIHSLLTALGSGRRSIIYPDAFPVIAAMLNAGLKSVTKENNENLNLKPAQSSISSGDEPLIYFGTYFSEGTSKSQ